MASFEACHAQVQVGREHLFDRDAASPDSIGQRLDEFFARDESFRVRGFCRCALRREELFELEHLARRHGAAFREVVLLNERDRAIERFGRRAQDGDDIWIRHHQRLIESRGGPVVLGAMYDNLLKVVNERPGAVVVPSTWVRWTSPTSCWPTPCASPPPRSRLGMIAAGASGSEGLCESLRVLDDSWCCPSEIRWSMGEAAAEEPAVEDFIASLGDEQAVNDCRVLVDLMRRVSGHEPRMWNVGTIGFGAYHYTYDSGREGDCQTIGFYPRKGKTTIYLMDGTARHSELLARLGKHTTSRVCVYVKRLADIDLKILEQILRQSYEYITSQDGRMGRVVS